MYFTNCVQKNIILTNRKQIVYEFGVRIRRERALTAGRFRLYGNRYAGAGSHGITHS